MSDIVKEIIERAVKDEAFRKLLFENSTEALKGYTLTDEDRSLLESLDEENFDQFAGGLGDRTTKGTWVPGVG
ncbi:MAG: Os1348 family NHLP clan protein [Chloroflexota bacterium]|nr:hypothetical protein [Anaerolineales bacterium]MCB8967953.1 hypothetical protein [Ardenticatenaceae bacterium]